MGENERTEKLEKQKRCKTKMIVAEHFKKDGFTVEEALTQLILSGLS